MQKILLIGIIILTSHTFAFGETLTVQTSNITQTSVDITVSGTDIRETLGIKVVFNDGTQDIPLFKPLDSNCYENVCTFPPTKKTVPGLTCGTRYNGTIKLTGTASNISKPIEFETLACETGIRVTFDSITIASSNKALVKLRIQDSSIPAIGLDVKAVLSPIPDDPLSPSPADNISFSRVIGLVSNASNERTIEKEIDIGCTQGRTPKKYTVAIEATSRSTQPKVGRSGILQFTSDICPETSSVGNEEGTPQTTDANTYTFLTPLPLGEDFTQTSSINIGGTGGILGVLQKIFTIMLIVAVVLAVVFMIIGGARYATGDTIGGVQGGRQIITNAVTGLLFALFAWLLLNVINPDLLRFTLSIPKVVPELTNGTSTPPVAGSGNTIPGEGCPASTSDEECFRLIAADEDAKRAELGSDIKYNHGTARCMAFDERVCTMVGLLSDITTARLIEVKNDCVSSNSSCEVMITGGTEYWAHSSGGNHKQFTAVDLRIGTEPFDGFIKTKTKLQTPPSFCNEAYTYKGLRFCNEKGRDSHWHVDTVTTTGGGSTTIGELIKFENIGANNLGVWGKANGQPITPTEAKTLANGAHGSSWYAEVQRVAGNAAKTLAAIIMVESTGNPDATKTEPDGSKSCGLGQILTNTAKSLDTSLRNKSVEEICTKLKEPNYNIRLSYQYYKLLPGDFKKKVAAYNGDVGNQGATGASQDCSGLMRFECPWDSGGCYDETKPNDNPINTSCTVNTGYEVTRFYVDKVKKVMDQL